MKQTVGYILLITSFLLLALVPAVPFLDLSTAEMAGITTFLIVVAEVTSYLALFLLGRGVWQKIKRYFSKKNKTRKLQAQED